MHDTDCPNSEVCGFLSSAPCSAAVGKCFTNSGIVCLAYSPGCACDGTEITIACTGFPPGYASKPLRHAGVCTDGGPACFTDTVGADFKACMVDADCTIKNHQTDCCGSIHAAGVSKTLSSAYDSCESVWDRHFPLCGCASMVGSADDGKVVTGTSTVAVHCVPSSAGRKTCQTTVLSPLADGGSGDCASAADCASGYICGFVESAACSAKGQCFRAPGATCQAYSPGCACDGSVVNIACNGLPIGYETAPLRHRGVCVDGG